MFLARPKPFARPSGHTHPSNHQLPGTSGPSTHSATSSQPAPPQAPGPVITVCDFCRQGSRNRTRCCGPPAPPRATSPTSPSKRASPVIRTRASRVAERQSGRAQQSGAAAPPSHTSPRSRKGQVSLTSRNRASESRELGTAMAAGTTSPTSRSKHRSLMSHGTPTAGEVPQPGAAWPGLLTRGTYSRSGPIRRNGPRRAPRSQASHEHPASRRGRGECSGFIHF